MVTDPIIASSKILRIERNSVDDETKLRTFTFMVTLC